MAQTLPDVVVGDTWVDLNTVTGIAVGTRLALLNKSTTWIQLAEGTEPAANYKDGVILRDMESNYAQADIPASSLTIWAKSAIVGKLCRLSVQAVA